MEDWKIGRLEIKKARPHVNEARILPTRLLDPRSLGPTRPTSYANPRYHALRSPIVRVRSIIPRSRAMCRSGGTLQPDNAPAAGHHESTRPRFRREPPATILCATRRHARRTTQPVVDAQIPDWPQPPWEASSVNTAPKESGAATASDEPDPSRSSDDSRQHEPLTPASRYHAERTKERPPATVGVPGSMKLQERHTERNRHQHRSVVLKSAHNRPVDTAGCSRRPVHDLACGPLRSSQPIAPCRR